MNGQEKTVEAQVNTTKTVVEDIIEIAKQVQLAVAPENFAVVFAAAIAQKYPR